MRTIDKDVVNDVLAAIAQEVAAQVGELRYNLWFRENVKLILNDLELVVGVPNLFFQEWLQSNFLLTLRKAAETVTGERLAVRITVDGSLFRDMRRRQCSARTDHQKVSDHQKVAEFDDAPRTRRQRRPSAGQTLGNFVVGDCNRLAYCAALEVARAPTGQFNPLMFYGPLGVGKTHLLRGVAHMVRKQHPELRVVYMTAEVFTNSFLQDMRSDRLGSFRQQVRGADLLLVDDVHFLGSKRATQGELLHTYEALDAEGKQVVMAADRHPGDITDCCADLRNRMIAGMACRLEPPDYATRLALLGPKARALGLLLKDDVLDFIATHLRTNVRELIGAVNCLKAYAAITRSTIDLLAAKQVLFEILKHNRSRRVSLKEVEQVVSQTLDVSIEQLHSSCRSRVVSHPRMLAMYLARKHTGVPYDTIGQYFGGRNHSTAMFAERRVLRWIEEGSALKLCGRSWPVGELVSTIERQLE